MRRTPPNLTEITKRRFRPVSRVGGLASGDQLLGDFFCRA